MLGILSKLFGSKSDRDIKSIQPLVDQIKIEYPKLAALSHDDLRQRTLDFKSRIAAHLADIDKEIATVKAQSEEEELDMNRKTEIYDQLDRLQKDRDA